MFDFQIESRDPQVENRCSGGLEMYTKYRFDTKDRVQMGFMREPLLPKRRKFKKEITFVAGGE